MTNLTVVFKRGGNFNNYRLQKMDQDLKINEKYVDFMIGILRTKNFRIF